MKLDIDYVRDQFDQIDDRPGFVFCSNAGGSFVANQVNQVLEHYNHHTRVQPYERYETSALAGEAMDRAMDGWSAALGIARDELTIGPSTSMNTFVMAQAIGAALGQGDEIVVTNLDHEANNGAWRRMAESRGVTVREWQVDPASGLLDTEALDKLLGERTRWVFFSHCSNLAGTANPVAEITAQVRANSPARVFVDAVAYAPHHISDLKALDVDGYAFSLYKVFGPHQGLMYVRDSVAAELAPQCHYFNAPYPGKHFNPAGPQHAQVAGCAGVIDYFDDLYRHHFGDTDETPVARMQALHRLILAHENTLAQPILDCLGAKPGVHVVGKTHTRDDDRAPTIAFHVDGRSSLEVSGALQALGIGCESGDFYARRLVEALGLDAEDGVVRISLVHYGNDQDVEKVLSALDSVLTD